MDKEKVTKLIRTARWSVLPLILITALLLLLVISTAAPTRDSNFSLTILHTNDMHSHDESFPERGRVIGGLPRIGHMIRLLKEKNPQALVIDAGDIFQGTPLFTRYHGEVEVSLLNKMGYDLYTIGNHEFDDGPQNLAKQLKQAKFKIISCNLDCTKQPELGALVEPCEIKEINGQKVGFIGAITPDLSKLALNSGGVTAKCEGKDWIKPIAEEVALVKGKGVNKIILVTHCGVEVDKIMGEQLPDVDAIIGGHSHTRLDKAIVVPHPDGSSTTIVQTGCFGRALGKLDLTFDPDGKVIDKDTHYHLINITDKIQPDAEMQAYVEKMAEPLLPLRQTIAGTATGDFDNRFGNLPWDSSIGDLICDSLYQAGKEYGVEMAFQNRGGIRGRIEHGPISQEKIEEVLPFENHIVFATVNGATVLRNLEHSLGGPLGGSFLDEHGLKLAYDPVKPRGERLVFALVQDKKGEWKPISRSENYKIAINDYSFNAGEGYDFKEATDKKFLPDRLSVALTGFLKTHPTVTPALPSRIVPLTPDLLNLEKRDGTSKLVIKGCQPDSRVTLFWGTEAGIENINGIPVPLSDPKVLKTGLHSGPLGEIEYPLPLKLPADTKKRVLVVAVIQPPKAVRVTKRTLISYPLSVER